MVVCTYKANAMALFEDFVDVSNTLFKMETINVDITNSINAINRIADVISKDETPVTLPEPPKLDQVGGFLIGIGHQLRQLPDDIQLQTVIEILQLIQQKK
ncbi:hypothetical protein KQX54_014078 [Cotesia glomerata]|uniref:Uncharacterized protein n=1 Tax=Cotesia glomerata TaxID=32391 RepID=A0AAV7HSR7_COTGL|nr:hypothetical protein KQX54_014078 [Cotesia glomerata]